MSQQDTFDWLQLDYRWGAQSGSFGLLDTQPLNPTDFRQFNRPGVVFHATPTTTTGRWLVQFKSWDGPAKNFLRGTHKVRIGNGASAHLYVPLDGEWSTIEIAGETATGTSQLNGAWFTAGPLDPGRHGVGDGVLAELGLTVVAPAGVQTVSLAEVVPGWAHWSVSTDGAGWTAAIECLNAAGAWQRIGVMSDTAGGFVQDRDVVLPYRPCRLWFNNTGGVNRVAIMALTAAP